MNFIIFGFLFGALGGISLLDPARRRHYMHVAMVVALLCILGGGRVAVKFATMSALAIGSHITDAKNNGRKHMNSDNSITTAMRARWCSHSYVFVPVYLITLLMYLLACF